MSGRAQQHIREAGADDAEAIAHVQVMAWHETYAGLIPEEILAAMTVESRTLSWRRMLSNPSGFALTGVLVAEANAAIVGFGACGPQRDASLAAGGYDGEISSIYIGAAHQQRGIGMALMRAMEAALRESGAQRLALWVLDTNMPARRFYEKCGGIAVTERIDQRGKVALREVAYGWSNLAIGR